MTKYAKADMQKYHTSKSISEAANSQNCGEKALIRCSQPSVLHSCHAAVAIRVSHFFFFFCTVPTPARPVFSLRIIIFTTEHKTWGWWGGTNLCYIIIIIVVIMIITIIDY